MRMACSGTGCTPATCRCLRMQERSRKSRKMCLACSAQFQRIVIWTKRGLSSSDDLAQHPLLHMLLPCGSRGGQALHGPTSDGRQR